MKTPLVKTAIAKICTLTAVVFISHTTLSQTRHNFTHYSISDGLRSNRVDDLVADGNGFIWINSNALSITRFDGYEFRHYTNPHDSMYNNLGKTVVPLAGRFSIDYDGDLWVDNFQSQYDHRTLHKYDRNTDNFIRFQPDIKSTFVSYIEHDRKTPVVWYNGISVHNFASASGDGLYEFNLETKQTFHYRHEDPDSVKADKLNTFRGMLDRGSSLFIFTTLGLWEFNKASKTFNRPQLNPADTTLLFQRPTYWQGHNWLRLDDWILLKVDSAFSIIHQVQIPKELWAIINSWDIDSQDIFWITTTKGLYKFNPFDKSLEHIKDDDTDNQSVERIFVDRNDNIWVGSYSGLKKYVRPELSYHFQRFDHLFQRSSYEGLQAVQFLNSDAANTAVLIGAKNFIWTGQLTRDSLVGKPFEFEGRNERWSNFLDSRQGSDHLWIVTWGRGVVGIPIDHVTGRLEEKNIKYFTHDPANPNTISSNASWFGIYEDPEKNLWVATFEGLCKINLNLPYGTKGSVQRFNHIPGDSSSILDDRVMDIEPGDDGGLWVATERGLDFLRDGIFKHMFRLDGMNNVHAIKKTSSGDLYFFTADGVYTAGKAGGYTNFIKLRLPYAPTDVLEDKEKRLWMPTYYNGLILYIPEKDVVIRFYDGVTLKDDAIVLVESPDGRMILCQTRSGLITFDPSSFRISDKKVNPVLTRLEINNQLPVIGSNGTNENDFFIPADISVLDELILDYKHNDFSVTFSALEMIDPLKNLYQYKLEGYDNDWIRVDWTSRKARYTNLDAGTYTFRVKASNHHGVWSDLERTLVVKILPPPWKTWWAYTGYSLIVAGLLFGARRMIVQQERLKANLDLAKVEQEKEHFELEKAKEVDQLKSRFFANISHEFRTPITLVLGPLKDIQKQLTNPEQKTLIGSVIRNGQRLQRLINQLLDLSKVEADKMKLNASYADLVQLLREIASSYESVAREKNIRYFFYPEVQELMMYINEEKTEKVIHNLLSNAFKFTKDGGEIILNLKINEKNAVIAVSDSGIGIPDDQLDKVFDRFHQVDNSQTRGYEGSGLGLALAKELVELHHGKISVTSKVDKGSTFTVVLPLGKDHLRKDEIIDNESVEKTEVASEDFISSNGNVRLDDDGQENKNISANQPVLLIVEDNIDMRQYIRKTLTAHYQTIEAENGKEGVKKAEEIMPDLIISDIMMPEMDGYKLCSLIKTNELTSHIPVILLTAKADRDSKLSGLEIGADDYLVKPFDADELKLIVRNRIEEKRKMREHFSKEITLEPKQIAITSLDEKFITKVLSMIETHIDDEDFSIEDFSQEAGCSRMQFYRKIKALTDQTPSQFVRSIRLKRAAQLLIAKSDNVTQIAYSVGFSSLAYFNKCFKEQYGMTPGQYTDVSKTDVKL